MRGRVEHFHIGTSQAVLHRHNSLTMVVSADDQVKACNFTRNPQGGIFLQTAGSIRRTGSTMKKPDNYVRTFIALNDWNPMPGCFHHIIKAHAAP